MVEFWIEKILEIVKRTYPFDKKKDISSNNLELRAFFEDLLPVAFSTLRIGTMKKRPNFFEGELRVDQMKLLWVFFFVWKDVFFQKENLDVEKLCQGNKMRLSGYLVNLPSAAELKANSKEESTFYEYCSLVEPNKISGKALLEKFAEISNTVEKTKPEIRDMINSCKIYKGEVRCEIFSSALPCSVQYHKDSKTIDFAEASKVADIEKIMKFCPRKDLAAFNQEIENVKMFVADWSEGTATADLLKNAIIFEENLISYMSELKTICPRFYKTGSINFWKFLANIK